MASKRSLKTVPGHGETTKTGFVNKHGQVVIRNTGRLGTDHLQYVYQLSCSRCGFTYTEHAPKEYLMVDIRDVMFRLVFDHGRISFASSSMCSKILQHLDPGVYAFSGARQMEDFIRGIVKDDPTFSLEFEKPVTLKHLEKYDADHSACGGNLIMSSFFGENG